MPNSYVLHTGNGSTTTFSFAGIDGYLSTGYIKVYLDGSLQTTGYTIDVSGGNENIVFSAAPDTGVVIKIARETPTTEAGFTSNIVDFSNGSVLTAEDLDRGFQGMLHIVQESNDTGSGALPKNAEQTGWNAGGLPVKNAAVATDPGDLVTKAQLDSVALYGASTIPQSWSFTGNGSATSFALSPSPSSTAADMFIVEVGGVLQIPTTDYSVTTTEITFAVAPDNGYGIRVRNFGVARNALDVVPAGTITSSYLATDAVTTAKIANDAVTAAKIADDAINTANIVDDAVTNAKIADDAVENAQLADNAVATANIQTSAVTTAKIANDAVTSDKLAAGAVDSGAMGLLAVALANMKEDNFAGSGNERVLHVDTTGKLTAKDKNVLGLEGAMTGNIDAANTYKVINLPAPVDSGDAARKNYVDTRVGDKITLTVGTNGGVALGDYIVAASTPGQITAVMTGSNLVVTAATGTSWKFIAAVTKATTPTAAQVFSGSVTAGTAVTIATGSAGGAVAFFAVRVS